MVLFDSQRCPAPAHAVSIIDRDAVDNRIASYVHKVPAGAPAPAYRRYCHRLIGIMKEPQTRKVPCLLPYGHTRSIASLILLGI